VDNIDQLNRIALYIRGRMLTTTFNYRASFL